MDITCRAKSTLWHPNCRRIYSCNIVRSDLRPRNSQNVLSLILTHEESNKDDEDIRAVVILDSKLEKVPQNFQDIFQNLTILCIKQCNLARIERRDLREYTNLKELWMPNNKIKELPDDLFVDHPRIERISFSNNQISIIGSKLLDTLDGLRYANFNRNQTIDVTFDVDDHRMKLEDLRKLIRSNCGFGDGSDENTPRTTRDTRGAAWKCRQTRGVSEGRQAKVLFADSSDLQGLDGLMGSSLSKDSKVPQGHSKDTREVQAYPKTSRKHRGVSLDPQRHSVNPSGIQKPDRDASDHQDPPGTLRQSRGLSKNHRDASKVHQSSSSCLQSNSRGLRDPKRLYEDTKNTNNSKSNPKKSPSASQSSESPPTDKSRPFKPKKRNFSHIRNSFENFRPIPSVTTGNFGVSNLESISSTTSSSYGFVEVLRSQLISSGSSINSQQSFQRIQFVTHRRAPAKHTKQTQTDHLTFTNDINKFLFNNEFKDFAIKNDNKTYNVHKFVLAARSPVVYTMVQRHPSLRGIELPCANDNMIEHLLGFIYEDQLPPFNYFEEFLQIYDLAAKLQLKELAEYSRSKLLPKINAENAIECLEVAAKYDDKELKVVGIEHVQKMFPQRKFKRRVTEDCEELMKMVDELRVMRQAIQEATSKFNQLSFFESGSF